jgi:hypothetical protein
VVVFDLLAILKMLGTLGVMVSKEGSTLKPEDVLRGDSYVSVLQSLSGR